MLIQNRRQFRLQGFIDGGGGHKSTLTPETANGIVSLVLSVYEDGVIDFGDLLVEKYVKKLLSAGFPEEAMKLISTLSEKTEKPFSDIIRISLEFTRNLVNSANVEMARESIDGMTRRITSDQKLSAEKKI